MPATVLAKLVVVSWMAWGPQERLPLHIGGAVKPPTITVSDAPKVSEEDRKLYRQCGQVYLWVEESGEPSRVQITRSTNVPGIDAAFLTAVKSYRFKPATMDGKPVTVDLYIDVCF